MQETSIKEKKYTTFKELKTLPYESKYKNML